MQGWIARLIACLIAWITERSKPAWITERAQSARISVSPIAVSSSIAITPRISPTPAAATAAAQAPRVAHGMSVAGSASHSIVASSICRRDGDLKIGFNRRYYFSSVFTVCTIRDRIFDWISWQRIIIKLLLTTTWEVCKDVYEGRNTSRMKESSYQKREQKRNDGLHDLSEQ